MTKPETAPEAAPRLVASAWGLSLLRGAAICIGLGVMFAWLGVYETGEIPFLERVVYWTILMAVGFGATTVVNPLVFERWMPAAHPALQIAVVACLISLPITAGLTIIEFTSDGTLSSPTWLWVQFGFVLVISVLLTAAGWTLDRLRKQSAVTPPTPTAQPESAPAAQIPPVTVAPPLLFADRLPAKFRAAQIHAVSAEDHYLRVHTSAGETMILMRLADAIRELAALEGMQTHRSWWVAKQGLADAARGDGKVTLKLKSGAEAPVSRTYLKAVKDAGWL